MLCRSTEEMIAEIELINSGNGPDDKEITSSDFDAMFPSLHIENVAKQGCWRGIPCQQTGD